MAGGGLGVRAGRRGRYGWLRSAATAGAALAALVLSGGSAAAAVPHWTLVTSPDPSAESNHLTGVSCVSATY